MANKKPRPIPNGHDDVSARVFLAIDVSNDLIKLSRTLAGSDRYVAQLALAHALAKSIAFDGSDELLQHFFDHMTTTIEMIMKLRKEQEN